MSDSDNAPLKVIINGQEFDETEASDLIETGRKTREMEQKWNTKLDNVWPEYGQKTQQLKQYEAELAEAKAQLTEFQTKKAEGIETSGDLAEAREAARKLGIVLNDDLEKTGYIKKSDLDTYFQTKQQEQEAVNKVLSEADNLEKEINGEDGRPSFNKRAVLAYASAYGFSDLKSAYEDMNKDRLDSWKNQQIAASKAKELKTLGSSGSKEPKQPRVGNDNLKQALNEALYGSEE